MEGGGGAGQMFPMSFQYLAQVARAGRSFLLGRTHLPEIDGRKDPVFSPICIISL